MANTPSTPPKSIPIKDADLKEQYHRLGPYTLLSKNPVASAVYDGDNVLIEMKDGRTLVIHGSAFKGMELA